MLQDRLREKTGRSGPEMMDDEPTTESHCAVVCTITDDNYAAFAAAMLASLYHNNPNIAVAANVVARELSGENKRKLAATAERFGRAIRFHEVGSEFGTRFDRAWTHSYIPVDAFYKFFLAEILSNEKRVLYLDSDVMARASLGSLFEIGLGSSLLGAVQTYDEPEWGLTLIERFGLPDSHRYFNSGVMLLELDRWRKECIGKKLVECAVTRETHDEVAFNVVFAGRCKLLHPKYNVDPHLVWVGDKLYLPGHYQYPIEAYREAAADPVLVHFAGPSKPWQYNSIHAYKKEFYRYLAMTPFVASAPVDRNLRNIILRPAYQANFALWRRRAVRKMKEYRARTNPRQ